MADRAGEGGDRRPLSRPPRLSSVQTTLDGQTKSAARVPIAYLWTRTVPCPNPAERPHAVPLVRQTWLVKKTGRSWRFRMVPDRKTMTSPTRWSRPTTADGLGLRSERRSRSVVRRLVRYVAHPWTAIHEAEAMAGRMARDHGGRPPPPGSAGRHTSEAQSRTCSGCARSRGLLARPATWAIAADEPHSGRMTLSTFEHRCSRRFGDLFTDRQLACCSRSAGSPASPSEMLADGSNPSVQGGCDVSRLAH